MYRQTVDTNIMSERLPAVLVSGLVVGSGIRQFNFGYLLVQVLVFAAGALVGWLFGR